MEPAMKMSRREAVKTIGSVIAAPAIIRAAAGAARFPIAFSTLGCPKWEWKTILDRAAEWGYAAIELRGIKGEMDLTKVPQFSAGRIQAALDDLAARGLKISDLGASARMHESEPSVRTAQLDEGKRFIDLAHKLKAPYVRVFGDKLPPNEPKKDVMERVVAGLGVLGKYAKSAGVQVIIESHGDFTDARTLEQMLKAVAMPEVGLLWDAHHTFVAGHEQPADTLKILKPYIRHTHLKDSKGTSEEDTHYVLLGTGRVPVRETVKLLARQGYKGYYCFEWEKAWHPEIEEPEVAFPHYAKVMKEYLTEAGVRAS
jgi:sugar phosphate isomerase/epimerase